jgi:4-amino-4-deoxy-L-arabinose transferase-like glycosyltransferase
MGNKSKYLLVMIIALSAAARLVYLFGNGFFYWDEIVYLTMADAFSGNFYAFEFFRPPLWPLLLSAFPKCAFCAKSVSFAVSLAAVPLVFWLARRCLDHTRALLVAFFYAFNHFSLYYAGVGTAESLSVILLFVSFLSFYSGTKSKGHRDWILAGAALGLAAMSRHMAAFMIFPFAAYLLMTSRFDKKREFAVLALSALAVMSPWLIAMQAMFGNMLYPQLSNIGTSTAESSLFYVEGLPFFLGLQGLLIAPALAGIRKDRFTLMAAVTALLGFALLSMIGHKELRYIMVLIPAIASLEGIGMAWIAERFGLVRRLLNPILVVSAVAALVFVSTSAEFMPYDRSIEECMSLAEPYHTESTMSTHAPLLAFMHKRPAVQVPDVLDESICDTVREYNTDYLVYYEDWETREIRGDFENKTSGCMEPVIEEQGCIIYRAT